MIVEFDKSFNKSLNRLNDKSLYPKIQKPHWGEHGRSVRLRFGKINGRNRWIFLGLVYSLFARRGDYWFFVSH